MAPIQLNEYQMKLFLLNTLAHDFAHDFKPDPRLANSEIIQNLNEIIGFVSIVPEIPGYVKTVGSTTKLIFTGAKTKKIKDDENLGDALDELDLSA